MPSHVQPPSRCGAPFRSPTFGVATLSDRDPNVRPAGARVLTPSPARLAANLFGVIDVAASETQPKKPLRGGGFLFDEQRELLCRGATSTDILVYQALRAYSGRRRRCWRYVATIAEDTGLKPRTIKACVEHLRELKAVATLRTPRNSHYALPPLLHLETRETLECPAIEKEYTLAQKALDRPVGHRGGRRGTSQCTAVGHPGRMSRR